MAKLRSTGVKFNEGECEKFVSIEMTLDELEEIIEWGESINFDHGSICHVLLLELKDILEKNK